MTLARSRIRVLKQLLRQKEREAPVVPERFAAYCESGDEDVPPGLFQSRTHKFRFYFTAYPNLQKPSRSTRDLDNVETRYTYRSFSASFNSIQEKLYARLFDATPAFDNDWFGQNDAFIRELTTRHRFALAALTNKSQQHVQAFLKGEDLHPFCERVRRWNTRVYGFLPIFFHICQKKKHNSTGYEEVVRDVCPHLTDQQITDAVAGLVQDIRHVFATCPRTTRTMTLWRGLRSSPSPLRYPGFAATSINPLHALQYAGDACCLQRITILPKTPLLFVGGLSTFKKELECILPDDTMFYEWKRAATTIPTTPKATGKCPTKTRRIVIQHAVAL